MNIFKLNKVIAATLICGVSLFTANIAQAVPVVGSVSTVEFGTGNSADNWIVDIVDVGNGTIEIAIKAKNRFLGDIIPSADFVYQAEAGNPPTSGIDPTPAAGLTKWNFEWSAIFSEGLNPDDYIVDLGVDFKPNDPDLANRLFFDITDPLFAGLDGAASANIFQDSQNIGFGFWPLFGDPAIMPIDPFAAGIYQFSLELVEVTGQPLSRIDMTVQVVPAPGMLALFGLGLAGLLTLRRRA